VRQNLENCGGQERSTVGLSFQANHSPYFRFLRIWDISVPKYVQMSETDLKEAASLRVTRFSFCLEIYERSIRWSNLLTKKNFFAAFDEIQSADVSGFPIDCV
jgi:hypothetical protein